MLVGACDLNVVHARRRHCRRNIFAWRWSGTLLAAGFEPNVGGLHVHSLHVLTGFVMCKAEVLSPNVNPTEHDRCCFFNVSRRRWYVHVPREGVLT